MRNDLGDASIWDVQARPCLLCAIHNTLCRDECQSCLLISGKYSGAGWAVLQVAGQLQALLSDKAHLAQENARLARENTGLQVQIAAFLSPDIINICVMHLLTPDSLLVVCCTSMTLRPYLTLVKHAHSAAVNIPCRSCCNIQCISICKTVSQHKLKISQMQMTLATGHLWRVHCLMVQQFRPPRMGPQRSPVATAREAFLTVCTRLYFKLARCSCYLHCLWRLKAKLLKVQRSSS